MKELVMDTWKCVWLGKLDRDKRAAEIQINSRRQQ
jgi:hypothetical protein